MTKPTLAFYFLSILALACNLTGNVTPNVPERKVLSAPKPATPSRNCRIETGFEDGRVNLRSCGGTHCPVIAILHEGERLTVTASRASRGWIPIRKFGGLEGWVNSKYCKGK